MLELGLRSSETLSSQAKEKAHHQTTRSHKKATDLLVFIAFKIAKNIADSFEVACWLVCHIS